MGDIGPARARFEVLPTADLESADLRESTADPRRDAVPIGVLDDTQPADERLAHRR